MPTAAPPRPTDYTATEVCELLGVTYRQLDYWCRQEYIRIGTDARGSGSRRRFSEEEVAALARCIERTRQANAILDRFASGRMWDEELADLA